MQVGGEARVGELRGSVVVVHKVDPARGCVPDLPARRQRTQLLTVHVTEVPGGGRRRGREGGERSGREKEGLKERGRRLSRI